MKVSIKMAAHRSPATAGRCNIFFPFFWIPVITCYLCQTTYVIQNDGGDLIQSLGTASAENPISPCPDSKVHRANMGPTWVLSAPGGPQVGLVNLVIWVVAAVYAILPNSIGPPWFLLDHCKSATKDIKILPQEWSVNWNLGCRCSNSIQINGKATISVSDESYILWFCTLIFIYV